jgi:uncharacterized membrane protein YhhN
MPVILYGAGFIWFLHGDLKEMLIPVILYTLVILTMLSAAINRKKKVNRLSYRLILAGAILFVISDSAIALDKFSFPLKLSTLAIISTYITAQYLITLGFIRQMREKTI